MINRDMVVSLVSQIDPEIQIPDFVQCCQTPQEVAILLYKQLPMTVLRKAKINKLAMFSSLIFEEGEDSTYDINEVVGHINLPQLRKRREMSTADFFELGHVEYNGNLPYIFIDNNAKILAVAHLDSVQSDRLFYRVNDTVYSPVLDDRLGVYVILDVLSKMFNMDILLTDGEESGKSTARYFATDKQYNWMFEVDRTGTTAALYQYHSSELVQKVQTVGIDVGHGSFTDISDLGHLGCAGVNFPCAYYNYHSIDANFNISTLNMLIDGMITFIDLYKDVHIPFDRSRSHNYRSYYNYYDYTYYGKYYNETTTNSMLCKNCQTLAFKDEWFCSVCGHELIESDVPSNCRVCDEVSCRGVSTCGICQMQYHDSDYLASFSVCKECLSGVFLVEDNCFIKFESDDTTESNKACLEILDALGE